MAVLNSTLRLTLLDNVSTHARRISGVLGGFNRQITAVGNPLRGVTSQLIAFGAGYIGATAGIRSTAGAAIEFESAFADVRKVLNGSDQQLENVRRSIIGMSKELPIAATGIAEIYAAAGQANIPIEEINKFSEMVAKVSTAWEVPVAETGQALAEIKNQLNLGVAEVGLFADALNHLSNNTAANAPKLLDYTKRVAANGEMFGFTAQQTLAFGGAMIATGAQSEVAATSFRNMGRALTKGSQATKMQREAMKRLGLDSVKTAKNMQENALDTTLEVIDKIQKLPEWERISIASALFGDEARALMPVINNATELRRQLGLVGDQANYAGSAFEEYTVRANTVGNVLQILRNKIADVFRGIGDDMLPTIKAAALGIGDVIDTLGERATVFDKLGAAVQGFMSGFGMDGGIRDLVNDLGDLLFGAADGAAAADQLGRVFAKFREWGASVRELSAAIQDNPILKFFADLAPYGFKLMLFGVGISMLAGTIRKLASALMFLSGASTAVAILKSIAKIGGITAGGVAATAGGTAATAGGTAATAAGALGLRGILARLGLFGAAAAGGYEFGSQVKSGDTLYSQGKAFIPGPEDALHGIYAAIESAAEKFFVSKEPDQFKSGAYLDELRGTIPTLPAPRTGDRTIAEPAQQTTSPFSLSDLRAALSPREQGPQQSPITLDGIRSALAPQGTQDVRVTNPVPPQVTVNAPITIYEAANGAGTAAAVSSQLGETTRSAVESGYMDAQ
jgi:TP901 family phage tail tape measure protein